MVTRNNEAPRPGGASRKSAKANDDRAMASYDTTSEAAAANHEGSHP